LFLYQLQPVFFYTRQDLVTWLFMQTGIHQWLLNNPAGCISFDILFYVMPLSYLVIYKASKKLSAVIAVVMLLVNWCYLQAYTLYPSNSMEGYIAWLLFPFVLTAADKKTFSLLFDGLRYFFIFWFVSAGVWKLVQGGVFSISQMSGVLLYQHNQLLTSSPGYWQSNLILYLIKNPIIGWLLYLSATLLELSFFIGFFTKKYDRVLVCVFVGFLILDYLIMRMPYFEVCPLLLTLWFKQSKEDVSEHSSLTFVENCEHTFFEKT
ncbi:MAG TPA: hypothetical protein PLA68_09855, partial [Panacibacter sp.]|nr:hypothetical protein [Panacibacter sp.]